jgi:hypothetical protein
MPALAIKVEPSPSQLGRVLAAFAVVEALDVVPGGHHPALVDRHRDRRRMREDEAGVREAEVGDQGLEVVAVRAEAVQPDHRGGGGGLARDLDAGEERHRGIVVARRSGGEVPSRASAAPPVTQPRVDGAA